MGILSSLLPGVRDLRAPLAAGYMWLLAAWIGFEDRIPTPEKAQGVFARVYDLGDVISDFGLAVVLSFCAYLLGILSSAMTAPLVLLLRGRTDNPRTGFEYGFLIRREVERLAADVELPEIGGVPEDELETVRARLMTEQPTLYGEYDRFQAEADFRIAIVAPLIGSAAALGFQAHLSWVLAGIVAALVLVREARLLYRRAQFALISAITAGKVKSPWLERIKAVLPEEARARFGSGGTPEDGTRVSEATANP